MSKRVPLLYCFVALTCLQAIHASADETPPKEPQAEDEQVTTLAPVVVTATRVETRRFEVPRVVNVIEGERIKGRGVPSLIDALDDEVGIWIEKRTAHSSDIVMRGLSGGNLLAMVDGGTLSTYWGEGGFAGDDMYGKVDPWAIERIEVVRGPASVLYGSNALGGVVNFITKSSPYDFTCQGVRVGGHSEVLASTSPSMWRVRQEVFGASERLRWHVGASYWDAGGTRDGSGQRQTPTGGHGYFADAKLNWKLSQQNLLTLGVQYTHNPEVYRYYRPTQDNENKRLAVALKLDLGDTRRTLGFADAAHIQFNFQQKEDRRRWYDAAGMLTKRGVARWDTLEVGAQFEKRIACHDLVYGVDFETTAGESPDDEQFTETPVGGPTRKAAPDSIWSSLGAYIQDTWRIHRRLTVTSSLRFDAFRFATDVDSQYVPAGGLDPKEDEFTDYETALVGGVQAAYLLNPTTKVFGGWTRGFRQFAPRFGVSSHGFGVVVPSQLLDSVTADQFEVGIRHEAPNFKAEAAAYYTNFGNFQNIVRGTFQGQDWFDFNQNTTRDSGEDVFVTKGNGDAFVYGVEASAKVNLALLDRRFFGRTTTIKGGFMWNYGKDETNDIPLRHTHPTRGQLTIRYEHPCASRGLWLELASEFVRRYDRIPPSRLSGDVGYLNDPQDPSSGMRRSWGLPGYSLLDVRGGFKVGTCATLRFGVDNVLNRLYRPAHSRWDGPGRSFWMSVGVDF